LFNNSLASCWLDMIIFFSLRYGITAFNGIVGHSGGNTADGIIRIAL
jgi:hypothetical protein